MDKPVAVFSPNPYSMFSIATLELLIRSGVPVETIFVRSLFNPKRFIQEYRQNGYRFLRKIYRKLILRSSGLKTVSTDDMTIMRMMQQENIKGKNLWVLAQQYNIRIISVADYADAKVEQSLKTDPVACVVFTGGGIVPEKVIEASGLGVINCHMGILPYYRGMDVVEWPLLEKKFELIGMTTHLMVKSIDMGPIIETVLVDGKRFQHIAQLRNFLESQMPLILVRATRNLLNNTAALKPQRVSDGRLYFKMDSHLLAIAEKNLKNYYHET